MPQRLLLLKLKPFKVVVFMSVASAAAGLDVEARARVVAELAAACSRLALSDDDIEGGPADVVAVVAPIVRQCCPEEDVAAIVARVCG